jgi:hypothetical protein
MHKSATKCNEIIGKWCKNKHGASKIIDTFETYQSSGPYTPRGGGFCVSNFVEFRLELHAKSTCSVWGLS